MRSFVTAFVLVAACSAGLASARIGGGRRAAQVQQHAARRRALRTGEEKRLARDGNDGERVALCERTGTWLRESFLLAGEQQECRGREASARLQT